MGQDQRTASRLAVVAGLLVIYLVWGSTYLAITLAVKTIPPFMLAGIRVMAAGLVLFLWARLRGDGKPTLRQWRNAAAAGVLLFVLGNGGVTFAQQTAPSGAAALVVATTPAWLGLFDWLAVSGRRPRLLEVAGTVVGLAGIAVLSLSPESGGVPPLAALVLTISAAGWAAGSLFARGADLPKSPILVTGMEMLAGAAALMLIAGAAGELQRFDANAVSRESILCVVYLFFAAIVALPVYTWLLRVTSPTLVGTYAFVNPIVAVLLGWWIANEQPTERTGIAAALVVAGIALLIIARKPPTPPAELEP